MSFARLHQRIAAKTASYSEAPVIIVAFGDSVTQGYSRTGTIDAGTVYHQQVKEKLERHYPLCTFSVINAGAAGQTAKGSLTRLERDVIRYQPDLVIIGFGLNDAVVSETGLELKQALQTIIKRLQSETKADLILLSPNFMVTADNPTIDPSERHYLADFLEVFRKGSLARAAQIIRDCAREFKLPLADVYAQWQALATEGQDTNSLLANGLNHPGREGHRFTAELIFGLITEGERS